MGFFSPSLCVDEEKLLTRLSVCTVCIMSICNFSCFESHFGFEDRTVVLIVLVDVYCLPFTFQNERIALSCL